MPRLVEVFVVLTRVSTIPLGANYAVIALFSEGADRQARHQNSPPVAPRELPNTVEFGTSRVLQPGKVQMYSTGERLSLCVICQGVWGVATDPLSNGTELKGVGDAHTREYQGFGRFFES